VKPTGTNRPTTYTHNTTRCPRFRGTPPGWPGAQRPLCGCGTTTRHHPQPLPAPPAPGHHRGGANTQLNSATTSCTPLETTPDTAAPTPVGRPGQGGDRVTAVIAWGKRPVPFRTRKLRPTAPMVLHPGGCGRVGRRRTTIEGRPRTVCAGPPCFNHVGYSGVADQQPGAIPGCGRT
jgi:hypothetical protein